MKRNLAAVLIVLLLGIVCLGFFFMRRPLVTPLSAQTQQKPVDKVLGDFSFVDGTDYMIAFVTGSDGETSILNELFSSGRWYGGGYGYNQYNLVFLDIDSEAVYPLLDTNDYEIVSMEGFPTPVVSFNNQSETVLPKDPIAWWLFSIVKSDTDQDGDLSSLDKQTLSISDVGGRGYTEIIPDVDNVLATAFKDGDILLVIYRSNNKNYLAHVNLPLREVQSTEELPLGAEIK